MSTIEYDRTKAVIYAQKWALLRNPLFYDFSSIGGDCTNFISQCILAGNSTMNYSPVTGWYYLNLNKRSASWTSTEYFFKFITTNTGKGPFGHLTTKDNLSIGDVIQLGDNDNSFYHSLIITKINNGKIYISAHTNDALNRPLESYYFQKIRYIKIEGTRI